MIFKILGFKTEDEKDQLTNKIVLLGVEFNLNSNPLTFTIPEIKKAKWSFQLDNFIKC